MIPCLAASIRCIYFLSREPYCRLAAAWVPAMILKPLSLVPILRIADLLRMEFTGVHVRPKENLLASIAFETLES
jgi:hypothetical protein